MIDLHQVKLISDHYSKMFDTPTDKAGAITEVGLKDKSVPKTMIFVGMPTQDKPYYKLGTIGMSDFRQPHTKTPYTELVMTLPEYWQFNTGLEKWDWPINLLKTACKSPAIIKKPFTYYSSFALNDKFEPFDKSTDKSAVIFTPLAQFDKDKYSKLSVGLKKIHFMQVLAVSKFTYDAIDKPNRIELIDKIVSSNAFDYTVY